MLLLLLLTNPECLEHGSFAVIEYANRVNTKDAAVVCTAHHVLAFVLHPTVVTQREVVMTIIPTMTNVGKGGLGWRCQAR